jgi:hypothetical protein
VYQVDPLVCTGGGQRMSILAFVSDQHAISRILEHLGLRSPQLDRPPPGGEIREITRVAEQGEGWGVPASWDLACCRSPHHSVGRLCLQRRRLHARAARPRDSRLGHRRRTRCR